MRLIDADKAKVELLAIDENLTKLIEAMVCVCQEDEDVTIRQNALQCIYELTNKILDMQVKDKYLNPIVVDINQK